MYQRLTDTDPDLLPKKGNDNLFRPLTLILFAVFAIIFVFGIFFMTKNDSHILSKSKSEPTVSENMVSTTESEVIVTRPGPKLQASTNTQSNHRQFKKPDRVLLADKYLKITDCSETDDFFVEYFTINPIPFNIHANSTVNTRFIMKQGFHWATEVEIEIEKWLFGLEMFALKLPCFAKYFGSCRWNFCDMLRNHWDEQFCSLIHNKYDMNCQCPDILGPGIFEMEDWHYKPVVKRVMKYFSWFAGGWYNLKIKLYKGQHSTKPFLCSNSIVNLITTPIKDEKEV